MKVKKALVTLGILGVASAATISGVSTLQPDFNIEQELAGKSQHEKVLIKSQELAKVKIKKFTSSDLEIEVVGDIEQIDGGIQLFARAWRNGEQLGFGKDGSVEIERFRIYNPPVLVDSPSGDIVREFIDEKGNSKHIKLKYDPELAIKENLSHIISQVGKDGSNIINGKVGNTTSTFYPDANPESTSVDGYVRRSNIDEDLATIRAGAGTSSDDSGTSIYLYIRGSTTSNQWERLGRGFFAFDTSDIPDTDVIDSAVFYFDVSSTDNTMGGQSSENSRMYLVGATLASTTSISTVDFANIGSTSFGSSDTQINLNSGSYNTIALNSSGLENITTTGVSEFGIRNGWDYNNTTTGLTWGSSSYQTVVIKSSETGDVTSDPKLIVEHSAVASNTYSEMMMGAE